MRRTHLSGLDQELLQRRLVETGPYARMSRVESTGSTNADLLAAAAEPKFDRSWPHLSVLTAEEQTGGRGRLTRHWTSPKGASLSTSVVLRPSLPVDQWHWLSLTAGLALVTVLRERGLPAGIKWPNDVHVTGRKIAGILAAVPPQSPEVVIVGCGINVLLTAEELPTPGSTSLLLELERADRTPPPADSAQATQLRTELLSDWLEQFARLESQIQSRGDIGPITAEITSTISTVGQHVRVELPDGTAVRGTALDVENSGALAVEVTGRRGTQLDPEAGGGEERLWAAVPHPVRETFTAGDVIHLRQA